MGLHRFMELIDRAAHVQPGWNYKPDAVRRYQKIVTNAFFANQLVAGGVFDDETRVECTHTGYVVMLVVSGVVILLLLLIVYSLRRTCHELEDRIERTRMVPLTLMPPVSPLVMAAPVPPAPRVIVAPPPVPNAEAAYSESDSDEEAFVSDLPPNYSTLELFPSPDSSKCVDDDTGVMGGASAPTESSCGLDTRPYPLLSPDQYTTDGPVVSVDATEAVDRS